jgi:anaerobic selenocysteine-containing dehydrogenase
MPATATRTEPSICRFCHAACPILVDVEDGRAVRVLGDRENPIYHGYTCAKGRALPEKKSSSGARTYHARPRLHARASSITSRCVRAAT